jgi:NLI interacting factor-like phosphatase
MQSSLLPSGTGLALASPKNNTVECFLTHSQTQHSPCLDAKHPTIKDLTSVWKEFPQHSSKTTVLLDDSVDKAQRQPDNHICLVEYTSKVRAQDLNRHRDIVLSVPSSANPKAQTFDPAFDSLLLAIVGVLEVIREKGDVSAWVHEGGLRTRQHLISEDDLPTLLSRVNLEDQESTPNSTGLWFEDPEVLEYWINRGRATLEALQIPVHAGIAR